MKALSIRAPWWWWILYGGKRIENRSYYTRYRGPLLIHASKWWKKIGVDQDNYDAAFMKQRSSIRYDIAKDAIDNSIAAISGMKARGGHIVGICDLVDCIEDYNGSSAWHVPGQFGWKLDNVIPLNHPFPVKGTLGFFEVGTLTAEINRIMAERALSNDKGVLSGGA